MYIPIRSIIVNKQKVDEEHVDDFVEILERGRKVKPIMVRRAETAELTFEQQLQSYPFWVLVDGRHRLAAHKVLGKEMIECVVTL